MLPRILFPELAPGRLTLDAASSHHLAVVLRARTGDPLMIFDGQGREGRAVIVHADKTQAVVEVGTIQAITRESPLRITVIQALHGRQDGLGGAEVHRTWRSPHHSPGREPQRGQTRYRAC